MNIKSDPQPRYGASLLFAAGERPEAASVERALNDCQIAAQIAHRARDGTGIEILVNGLGFDLDLAVPQETTSQTDTLDRYGFGTAPHPDGLEAIYLYPGAHLSGGVVMPPVARALIGLTAELAVCLPVKAIFWHPAQTMIEPGLFSRSTLAWLAGGAFPALGLTALSVRADGSVTSRGLAHFIGQELTLAGRAQEAANDTVKLASRVIDRIVRAGSLSAIADLSIGNEVLCAEPAQRGGHIWVWRQS